MTKTAPVALRMRSLASTRFWGVRRGPDFQKPVEKVDEGSAVVRVESAQDAIGVTGHGFFDATKTFLARVGQVDKHPPSVERIIAPVDQHVCG